MKLCKRRKIEASLQLGIATASAVLVLASLSPRNAQANSAECTSGVLPNGETYTNTPNAFTLSLGNSGSSLVSSTTFPYSNVGSDKAPTFSLNVKVDEPTATTFTLPDATVCNAYTHPMVNDTDSTYTVQFSGPAATLAGLSISPVMNPMGTVLLNGTPLAGPTLVSGGTVTLGTSGGKASGFSYTTTYPGQITVTVTAGTVPNQTGFTDGGSLGGGDTPSQKTMFRPRLSFVGSAPYTSKHAGDCVGPVTVSAVDANNNPVAVTADGTTIPQMTLALSAPPAKIFLDSACVYGATQMVLKNPPGPALIANGQYMLPSLTTSSQSATFYFSSIQAQALQVTASLSGGGEPSEAAFQGEVILPNAPAFLTLSGPSSFNQGECSGAFTLSYLDLYGNAAPLLLTDKVNLAQSGNAVFTSDPACSSYLPATVSLPAGQSSYTFYLGDRAAESLTLSLSDASYNYGSATLSVSSLGTSYTVATLDPVKARTLAIRLYDRLAGIPASPTDPNITTMSDLIQTGQGMAAAHIATAQDGFYNVTVRNLATVLSNRNYDPTVPLNDFVATWIGIVRDGRPATDLLTGNYIYMLNDGSTNTGGSCSPGTAGCPVPSGCAGTSSVYSNPSTYAVFDSNYGDWPTTHKGIVQYLAPAHQCAYGTAPDNSSGDGLDPNATATVFTDNAGLLTTRQWGREHLYAGTNRRAIAFAFDVFLCHNIHQIADNTMPDSHIRQDVDRAPGGDDRVFNSSCKSCHGGMDGLAGGYAYFDAYPLDTNDLTETADFRMFYNPNAATVYPAATNEAWKMTKNSQVFPNGYKTSDDSWINYFTQNQNQALNWSNSVPSAGNGIHGVGAMLAASGAFPACMAQRVFTAACKRAPDPVADAAVMSDLANDFKASGYNMRRLFEKAASSGSCLGSGG